MTTTGAAPETKKQPIWQRRRGAAIAVAVAVIALITVLTDLPGPTSQASDLTAERSVMSEVNSDLKPCAYAIHQALGIWKLETEHRLSAAARAPTPGLLSDDQSACSFTSEGIYDLTNMQVPGTSAGKELGDLIATATLWTTSDALQAIEDVQTLMTDPKDVAAAHNLSKAAAVLRSDRQRALADERAADRDLATRLSQVDLPVVTVPARPSSG
jgi:hypothetical protein